MTAAILQHRREVLTTLQHRYIVAGFASTAMAKGYANTTIADIVSAAHVSKGTFYEYFESKESAYLDLHSAASAAIEASHAETLNSTAQEPDWRLRVQHLVRSRLETVASNEAFLAQAAIEPQVSSDTARAAAENATDRLVGHYLLFAGEMSKVTAEVAPIGAHVAYAGIATTAAYVGSRARTGPQAVRMLERPLTDIWIRLLHAI